MIQIEKISQDRMKELGIPESPEQTGPWSVWECEPSSFGWHYDQTEKAYVYEGKVKIKTDSQDVEINAGDFVTFPRGLSCQWDVLEKIKKVYTFE